MPNYYTEPERQTAIVGEADILVCGGGFAGVAAAVSAAREGARVFLLEKYGFLGGLATAALVITTPPLNNGINSEIASRLRKRNVYAACENSGDDTAFANLHAMDPEIVKYEFLNMLKQSNVSLQLHTYIVDAIVKNSVVKGIIIESKAGRHAILAKIVVDATGDADISAFAGAPFREVRKPMTMMFNMVGVDITKVLNKIGSWSKLKEVVKEGIDDGKLNFELGIYPEFGAPGVHAEKAVYEGEVNVWSGMLNGLSGIDPIDLSKGELVSREHVMRLASFFKNTVPGFEKSRIEYTSTQIGVRASRQIIGEACPTMKEIRDRIFKESVIKPYAKSRMRLPYGCIVPQKIDNLLVAGRCLSAKEDALGQLRLIPVCSATGQTAGVAAALCLKRNRTPRKLEVCELQEGVSARGMDLGLRKSESVAEEDFPESLG